MMNQSKKPLKEKFKQFKQWFDEKSNQFFHQFFQYSRHIQVLYTGLFSLVLLIITAFLIPSGSGATFSALAVLFVSAPVAFVVWHFRDENQSKDINLKEFQKISEWVTGAHFQDAKQGETLSGSLPENADAALHTFSKQDGAVGLQIAAVYNLLPFYRGDYGQAFEKPSVHLLHSAWKVLQHDILRDLDKTNDKETRDALIQKLHQRADSPLGQAITRVLLACDYAQKPLLHRHSEICPGICLSGMDFKLSGVQRGNLREILFNENKICDLNGAKWQGVRLNSLQKLAPFISLEKNYWKLNNIWLNGADLSGSILDQIHLNDAKLVEANLSNAELKDAKLNNAILQRTNLSGANLSGANLFEADLSGANLMIVKNLTDSQLIKAKELRGCLIDAYNFSQYEQLKQQQLQEKGLIVLHKGSDTISESLVCKHKTGEHKYPANYISFTIDLAATQAANPNWKISIE